MATAEALMTAEEFGQRPDPGYPEELVQGRIVGMPPPDRRHGYVCLKAGRMFGNFVDEHDLGRVMSNDSGVITDAIPIPSEGPTSPITATHDFPRARCHPAMDPKCPSSSSRFARRMMFGVRSLRKSRSICSPAC